MEKRTNDLILKIQDFRAIKNAEIILDGITVVAGVNGSGKSTISKVLYHFLKTVIHYDDAIQKHFEEEKERYRQALYNIFRTLRFDIKDKHYDTSSPIFRIVNAVMPHVFLRNNYAKLFPEVDSIDDFFEFVKNHINFEEIDEIVLRKILQFLQNDFEIDSDNIQEGFEKLKDNFIQKSSEVEYYFERRPSELLIKTLDGIYNQRIQVNIEAGGIDLADYQNDTLFSYPDLNNIAYFDSPMLLGVLPEKEGFEHWEDLNKILSKSKYNGGFSSDLNFDKSISDIIGGNTSLDEHFGQSFIYQRKDGKRFNLLDCATGLKSFSMIQMLVQNGFIGSRTLLIIDEPEAHLHPQWVVEYARLLVLLNKHTGCKFLLASHHPDMISALKYISQAEGTEDNFNLYFAEESEEEYKYNFENQNGSLERVFESLNIGLDKIDEYGKVEDTDRDLEDE